MQKPSLPKGTRDFSSVQIYRREYIFRCIREVFQSYGYHPLETPSMELLQTLTGKYGEEGDMLLFKILNNGDFLAKADAQALTDPVFPTTRPFHQQTSPALRSYGSICPICGYASARNTISVQALSDAAGLAG
jgi:hypothetical protein